MGFRLSDDAIHGARSGIISQGIALGAIQIPNDGQPIVLMRDRQTMGGYPQMGCVANLGFSKLARSMPGTEVSFIPTKIAELEPELFAYMVFCVDV